MYKLVWIITLICGRIAVAQELTVLKAARMFDARTGKIESPALIVISGNQIQSLG